jgi:alpha-glucoside transport system substrate-binding protein
VVGGDVGTVMKDSKGAQALMTFLGSPDAAAIWAAGGGYFSPNKNLDTGAYPNPTAKGIADAIIAAGDNLGFDMSDQAPAAFGGTKGAGEWKILQDFLKNPKDVSGAQKKLEESAKKAFKNAG